MNWFKIHVNDGTTEGYTYVGCSLDTLEEISDKVSQRKSIILKDLIYKEKEEIFTWEEWDNTLVPTVCINAACVVSVMQFKDDPRKLPQY